MTSRERDALELLHMYASRMKVGWWQHNIIMRHPLIFVFNIINSNNSVRCHKVCSFPACNVEIFVFTVIIVDRIATCFKFEFYGAYFAIQKLNLRSRTYEKSMRFLWSNAANFLRTLKSNVLEKVFKIIIGTNWVWLDKNIHCKVINTIFTHQLMLLCWMLTIKYCGHGMNEVFRLIELPTVYTMRKLHFFFYFLLHSWCDTRRACGINWLCDAKLFGPQTWMLVLLTSEKYKLTI